MWHLHRHHIQDPQDSLPFLSFPRSTLGHQPLLIQLPNQLPRPLHQGRQHPPAILKTAGTLHVAHRVLLDFLVFGFLLENVEEDEVVGRGADGMDDGEGEFAFGEVLVEALVV